MRINCGLGYGKSRDCWPSHGKPEINQPGEYYPPTYYKKELRKAV
jgi:hypothetical protein